MNLINIIFGSLLALGSMFSPAKTQSLGAAVPSIQALFETSLQASITSNATSATLVSGTDLAGNNIFGYYCFTVDAGTSQNEFMCGNASGTILTNLVRGVNPALGITANTSLQFAHRRGADVKMTDAPYISLYSNIFNGTQSIPAVMSYDPLLASTSTIGSNVNNIASVGYVNSVASSGAPDASFSQKGLTQLATTSQSLVGTATSSATTYLVVPNSAVNQSSTANKIPIANASGTIDPNYINTTGQNSIIPAGVIQMYASTTAPTGWLLCDGTAYSTTTYPTLYSLIGYSYGSSTGQFKVPDMRGRFPTSPGGVISSTIATTGGATSTLITTSTLPNYNLPSFNALTTTGVNTWGPNGSGSFGNQSITIGSGGGGLPLAIQNPYIVVNFIIKF